MAAGSAVVTDAAASVRSASKDKEQTAPIRRSTQIGAQIASAVFKRLSRFLISLIWIPMSEESQSDTGNSSRAESSLSFCPESVISALSCSAGAPPSLGFPHPFSVNGWGSGAAARSSSESSRFSMFKVEQSRSALRASSFTAARSRACSASLRSVCVRSKKDRAARLPDRDRRPRHVKGLSCCSPRKERLPSPLA